MKILDFAIDVEQAEQELYYRLADCSSDQTIKAIFQMIATKEMVLLQKLRELKKSPQYCEFEISRAPTQQRLRRNQNASCELLDEQDIRDDLSSYNYILRTEQLIYDLYTQLKERETDPQAQRLLDLLLNEKQLEIERINTLYDVARIVQ